MDASFLKQVFIHQSIFTVDMEAIHDPLKPGYTMSAIFRVAHPNQTVSLGEINGIIKGIKDPESSGRQTQKIHYEIGLTSKWFIVAARSKIPRGLDMNDPLLAADVTSTLERRASLLLSALETHFLDCEIMSLEDALLSSTATWTSVKRKRRGNSQKKDNESNGETGMFSRLLGSFGFGNLKRKEESHNSASSKRRRIDRVS